MGGGATATLADLKWRAAQGPIAVGSGKLAETLRTLKTKCPDGAEAGRAAGEPPQPVPRWTPSVVRDDSAP